MKSSPLIKAMEDAAILAGKRLIRDFGELENLQISQKAPGDFVTSADKKSDDIIKESLSNFRKQYGFVTEESGIIIGRDKKFRWIVDPLDGTTNFMHGVLHFCISIALEEIKNIDTDQQASEIVASVIYAPILGDIYVAQKGQGAYCNSRKINVAGNQQILGSIFSAYPFHCRGDNAISKNASIYISENKGNIRIFGSAALELAFVASGRLNGLWHDNLQAWDMAAGILLVQEAGGVVTEINGGSNMMQNKNIIAGNKYIHANLSTIIKDAAK